MFRWIWAKLTGGTLVTLEDYEFTTYKTIMYKHPNPKFTGLGRASVYWYTGVGNVLLLPEGQIYHIHYIKSWYYG